MSKSGEGLVARAGIFPGREAALVAAADARRLAIYARRLPGSQTAADTGRAMPSENVEIVRRIYAALDLSVPGSVSSFDGPPDSIEALIDPEIEWQGPREFSDVAETCTDMKASPAMAPRSRRSSMTIGDAPRGTTGGTVTGPGVSTSDLDIRGELRVQRPRG